MSNSSRQVPSIDTASLISIIWFLVVIGVFYWFYRTMKRIEQTLSEIKKAIESKA